MSIKDQCLGLTAERYNNDMEGEMINSAIKKKIEEIQQAAVKATSRSGGPVILEADGPDFRLFSEEGRKKLGKRVVDIRNQWRDCGQRITKKQQADLFAMLEGRVTEVLQLWWEDREAALAYHNKAKKKIEGLEKDIAALVEHNDKIRDRGKVRQETLEGLIMRMVGK